ncbi:mechanosensitive ion channel [Heliobacterium gestii]|uniref:Mechanosensitive ion channel n=1 Tax=Heliomicrobium gestii TaxID=2699 RepID=A0A845LGS1_HELGE|nr:mechanosensitive ion channel family protein [Heliomicrobium gestii]MBM7867797.1 small conductance mechanosensitive channel [Heliomicrobium gestii]MZP44190.1 mechanosensitive ion channel [Heliomicrobium gestii]
MLNWLSEFTHGRAVAMGLGDWAQPIAAFVTGAAHLLFALFLAWIALRFGDKAIDQVFRQRLGIHIIDEKRGATLASLLKSLLFYSVFFIVALEILNTVFGVQTQALLAGAGVVGVAAGFGAQSLVRDVITGFFIIFENQYAVGEFVTIGKYMGVVEEIGLRVTKVRDLTGELHIIPNGQVKEVSNRSRGPIQALVDIGVAYEEDIDRALVVLEAAAKELAAEWADQITDGPTVLGVTNLGPSEVVIRVTAKTAPLEQWRVEREMRRRFKAVLDHAGIEIPYPRQVLVPYGRSSAVEMATTGDGSRK